MWVEFKKKDEDVFDLGAQVEAANAMKKKGAQPQGRKVYNAAPQQNAATVVSEVDKKLGSNSYI